MSTVKSKDGTTIAFDQSGSGPALILIGGATQYRAIDPETTKRSQLLAPHFTVINYDRRGRGESSDTPPMAVEREFEDIEALINQVGGTAYLYGHSSGAALAMEATIQLGSSKVPKLAMYEAPYNSEGEVWREYRKNLTAAIAEDRRGDAAALFMKVVGMPADQIEGMRHSPFWPVMEGVAPTLAYDAAVMGEDASVPLDRAALVTVPALVMAGGASFPFMPVTAQALAKAMPHGQYRLLEGQTHAVTSEALVPALTEFFTSGTAK